MNYWVVKGKAARNNWEAMLRPKHTGLWRTGRPPLQWLNRDRVFFWESAPKLRIIAIGTIIDTDCGENSDGDRLYRVRYLTRRLPSMLTIYELRNLPIVSEASFLKAGPATSVFPLNSDQAEIILCLLTARNPIVGKIWPPSSAVNSLPVLFDIDFTAREGRQRLSTHLLRERDPTLVAAKKASVLQKTGWLQCEVCNFDFQETFGSIGKKFCEVHHKKPLSQGRRVRLTTLNDLAILCSNCHRIIHNTEPLWSVSKLRAHLKMRRVKGVKVIPLDKLL